MIPIDPAFASQALQQKEQVFAGDVAAGADCVWAAAETGDRAVKYRHTEFKRSVDVGDRHPVGVMVMPGQLLDRHHRRAGYDRVLDRSGCTSTDGIAERDLLATHFEQSLGNPCRFRRIDGAFVGAGDDTRHVAAQLDLKRAGGIGNGSEALQTFGDAAVDVLLREGFLRCSEDRNFLRAGFDGGFETLQV